MNNTIHHQSLRMIVCALAGVSLAFAALLRHTNAQSGALIPIPAYGSKRVELEYTEMLPVENLTSRFSFPLRPSFGQPQRVGELQINVQARSDSPISPLNFHKTF